MTRHHALLFHGECDVQGFNYCLNKCVIFNVSPSLAPLVVESYHCHSNRNMKFVCSSLIILYSTAALDTMF